MELADDAELLGVASDRHKRHLLLLFEAERANVCLPRSQNQRILHQRGPTEAKQHQSVQVQ